MPPPHIRGDINEGKRKYIRRLSESWKSDVIDRAGGTARRFADGHVSERRAGPEKRTRLTLKDQSSYNMTAKHATGERIYGATPARRLCANPKNRSRLLNLKEK
ncbi:hypothetical protein [Burkholderia plantarii]|uniref:hypothetical protein n=1 Tax=Burkholderia plantarii TaxID=41899 RepID=UPI00114D0052|nr:hypothetical protein [Burkholderia plantarii]